MSACGTPVREGQEWEMSAGQWRPTRIRVLENPSHPQTTRVKVGTVTADGRVIRKREILVSALNNAPSGYRLVKDVPAPAVDAKKPPRVFEASLGMEEALDAAERRRQPAPLAKVREALEVIRRYAAPRGDGDTVEAVLPVLEKAVRALSAVASISDAQWDALRVGCYKYHHAITSGAGAEGPCACGLRNGTSTACEALRTLQGIREDVVSL